jgi:ubiquinone/menaquinone biosynthesis C-methylase UbiE
MNRDPSPIPPQTCESSVPEFTGERVIEGTTPDRIWSDHVARYEFANRYVKDKTVLDIACGTGYGSSILKEQTASSVYGVDISLEAIEFAQEKYGRNHVHFAIGDISTIPFVANSFDAIVCFETIEHMDNHNKVLSELVRVLKPQGLLLISSPNRRLTSPGKSIADSPDNPFHTIEYSVNEFTDLLSQYFEIMDIYGQRNINKLFLFPFFERLLRYIIPRLYCPEAGTARLKKHRSISEYRYIVVICSNSKS